MPIPAPSASKSYRTRDRHPMGVGRLRKQTEKHRTPVVGVLCKAANLKINLDYLGARAPAYRQTSSDLLFILLRLGYGPLDCRVPTLQRYVHSKCNKAAVGLIFIGGHPNQNFQRAALA